MDELDMLVTKLTERGLTVTRAEAEAMAVRLAGSVTAYLAELSAHDADEYQPSTTPVGEVPEKFKDELSYTVEPPAAA